MAGTNRMLEGLKRNGESRGVVMNFLATQGLKKTMCNKERKRVVSLKITSSLSKLSSSLLKLSSSLW